MSVITFELKQEHIDLLKHLKWSLTSDKFIVSAENITEDTALFGADNTYEAIDLIFNGKPENFNPLETSAIVYTQEQKDKWDALIEELPMALDIVLYNGHFELGNYRTKYHIRQWKKVSSN
jgi:hypothetical protein